MIEGLHQTGYVYLVSDDPAMKISTWFRSDTGEVGKIEQELDEQGRIVKCRTYELTGELSTYSTVEYEENGKTEIRYNPDGSILGKQIWYYESGKTIIEVYNRYNPDIDELKMTFKSVHDGNRTDYYDGEGNLQSYDISDGDGKISTYNPDGSLKEYTVY